MEDAKATATTAAALEAAAGEAAAEEQPYVAWRGKKKVLAITLFCVGCVLVNYLGGQIVKVFELPYYFDCLGTILAGAFGGYIPGIVVGYLTSLVSSISDPTEAYYCLTGILIAVAAASFAKMGWFNKIPTILISLGVFVLLGGGVGEVITWFLYGPPAGEPATAEVFFGQLGNALVVDIVDKTITLALALTVFHLVPQHVKDKLDFGIWQQTPLQGEQLAAVQHVGTRSFSLRTKIVAIVAVTMIIVAVVTSSISYVMFHRSNIETQGKVGFGITEMASNMIPADRINTYLAEGEAAPGYAAIENSLAKVRDSFPDLEYLYVYKIMEDGCHVVFDPDTAEEVGADPGEVVPFDEAFMPYIDDLLAGKPIEPVVSNSDYGWLLTVYQPIYDDTGYCVAYMAADISMESVMSDEFAFITRIIILFLAFFVLICAVVIWLAEYGIIMPINSISRVSGNFAFDNERSREESVGHLQYLDIRTGDEVENLYHAVTKTSSDTVEFIAEAQEKAETIERMQDNLIMVMADLVESRDQFTGDHVRKTAAYTRVIMDQMRREGIYADVLTDEYVNNVAKSAPLHDVGKISVSDTILNKPGRLTDEEFAIMRGHAVAGEHILEDAKDAVSEAGYLDEATRLAAYHHEKWNGQGYPYGLAGEEIPLSARIMAVADVFDALVSKRSYKDGMPIEKAFDIIRKDAGTHFDPEVAKAFLHAEDEVRRIAEEHGDAHGKAADIREEPKTETE